MNLQMMENGSLVCPEDPGEPTTGKPRISITEDESRLLAELARGRRVLEVGTGLGISTRAMAETAKSLHTIDIDPWVAHNVWPQLPKGVTYDKVWTGARNYECVFIDAEHTTEALTADLRLAFALCDKGIIIVHDWKIPEVDAALDDTFLRVDTHHGLAIKVV